MYANKKKEKQKPKKLDPILKISSITCRLQIFLNQMLPSYQNESYGNMHVNLHSITLTNSANFISFFPSIQCSIQHHSSQLHTGMKNHSITYNSFLVHGAAIT